MRSWQAWTSSALAAGAVLSLTACGASSVANIGQGTAQAAVTHAANKSLAQGSEHVKIEMNVITDGKEQDISSEGDFQNGSNLGQLSMKITALGTGASIAADEIISGGVIYMKGSVFNALLPPGKEWLSLDVGSQLKKLGVDLSQYEQGNPAQTLAIFRKAGSVTKLGSSTIDGVETTHYQASVDVSKLPQAAALKKLGDFSYDPVNLWIDGNGVLRRIALSFSAFVQQQSVNAALTEDFSRYGEKVAIQVPDPSVTVDITKKLGG